MRRTEREIDRLEAIGVRATAPVREMARGIVPEEVYEKYLAPAVAYAEGDEEGFGAMGDSTEKGEEFDDAAVNSAADAVAAAMAGLDLSDVDAGASATEASASATSERGSSSTGTIEDDFEEMAANAIMSSSTVSASYVAPQTPYGAEAPAVRKNGHAGAREPAAAASAPAAEPEVTTKSTSTKAFDDTVGYWRKINDQCPDEEPLMDIMDMNVVFRQAAGLLNYLRISTDPDVVVRRRQRWNHPNSRGVPHERRARDDGQTRSPLGRPNRRRLRGRRRRRPPHVLARRSRRLADRDLPRQRRRYSRSHGGDHARERRFLARRLPVPPRVTPSCARPLALYHKKFGHSIFISSPSMTPSPYTRPPHAPTSSRALDLASAHAARGRARAPCPPPRASTRASLSPAPPVRAVRPPVAPARRT